MFWVLQACLLRFLLLLERLRQRRKFTVDILEKEPLLNHFGHVNFIAHAAQVPDACDAGVTQNLPTLTSLTVNHD